jgi:hypothetical protein
MNVSKRKIRYQQTQNSQKIKKNSLKAVYP